MHPEHVWLELPVLCTEPRQPNNHQLPRSSLCTAQVILDASVTHLVATQYVPSKLCWGSTGKSLHYERTLAKRVLRAHTEWLQGVQLRHSVPPVQYIGHGGWGLVVAQLLWVTWQLKADTSWFESRRLPGFSLSLFLPHNI